MDWREMEPGPELDRMVAERLGWQLRRIVPGRQVRYQLIWPDGTLEGTYNAERDAWLQVPSYSTNPKMALTLADVPGVALTLHRPADGGWRAELGGADDIHASGPEGEYLPSAALAIVRSWLAWQEASH